MTNETNVLIAGAGPTGLTLAIELARRGIAFRLVDAAAGPFSGSRGKGLQPRTLEVFEDLGVIAAIQAAGAPYPRFRLHAGPISCPAGRMGKLIAPTPSVPYPNLWMVPQWRTEEILRERLAHEGGRPEFGARLSAFGQDADEGVTATIAGAQGEERVRASYLVGCDGAHSVVRKTLGVRFEGEALKARPVVVADVEVERLDASHWHIWPFSRGGMLGLCPLPGTPHFQVTAALSERAGLPDTGEKSLHEFLVHRIAGAGLRVGRVAWASLFRPQVRMVDRYRVGRVLLAGDSAHVHPPSGGQGLNTGIQDAYNLGWKLAHVLRGAPEALLDSYEQERLPIAASVLGLSKRLAQKPTTRRGVDTQQLDLHYRGSPLAVDDGEASGPVRAGDRAPDAPCVDGDGASRRLFEVFRGTHVTVLAFDGLADDLLAGVRTADAVHVVRIVRHGEAVPAGGLVDADGHARRAYGIGQRAALVVVRPDGYIGYVGVPGTRKRVEWCLRASGLSAS